jgi:AAA+ ATPase superfamily predicted ATPase
MTWQLHHPTFRVTFFIRARDRKGLIFDITKQLRRHLCNFTAIHSEAMHEEAWARVTIDTDKDTEALDIWQELGKIESVTGVEIDAANTPLRTRNHLQEQRDKHSLPEETLQALTWEKLLPVPPPRDLVLKNPFDISRPATSKMFFGRSQETKLMQRELCEGEQGKALILYGPRRSGKSSICRNFLDRQLPPPFWGVFFSLQNSTRKTEDLLLTELIDEICTQFIQQLRRPDSDWPHYNDSAPLIRFRRILQYCITQVPDARLILALDEFGGALEAYEQHTLDHRFFTYWKELMDDVPQLSLIFALPTSSHNLLTREFSHAFSFAGTLPLAFLDAESAEQLLVDPLRDQHIMIRPPTVTFATKLTGGNPYYMALIGQRLIRHLNREKEKQLVTDDDLHLVVDQLIEEGSYQNFDFLRSELQCQDEFRILQAIVELSSSRTPKVQLKKIATWLNLPTHIVRQHLDRLRIGLILEEFGPVANPYYSFRIELVRRWLTRNRWFFTSIT